ncbi:MAG: YicC/YloC family endoribonuclease [Clostridia bacterium]
MYSMTGYGKGIAGGKLRVSIEMKSVNHRFLDLVFKFPRGFQFAEETIRKIVSSEFARGHIEVFLNYEDNREVKGGVVVDIGLAGSYLDAANILAGLGYPNNFGVAEAMRTPDIVKITECEGDEDILKSLVAAAAAEAAINLKAMRLSEGEKLIADIKTKIAAIADELEKVKQRAPFVSKEYGEKLRIRIGEALCGIDVDQSKIAAEVAFFADRTNIDEEITRLSGHISHYGEILAAGGTVGKKLDFLTQEAHREVNTIGSKSNDSEITRAVLFMKNQIEMIREQVQNLE